MENFLDDGWKQSYEIGGFLYCPEKSMVSTYTREASGTKSITHSVTLRNKENELLYLIVSSYPNIISREKILQQLWGGYNEVSANCTLTQTLKGVRSAFVQEGKELIITVPRVGFRLRQCQLVSAKPVELKVVEHELLSLGEHEPEVQHAVNKLLAIFTPAPQEGEGNSYLWIKRGLLTALSLLLMASVVQGVTWFRRDVIWVYPAEKNEANNILPVKGETVVVDKYSGELIVCSSSLKDGYCYQS